MPITGSDLVIGEVRKSSFLNLVLIKPNSRFLWGHHRTGILEYHEVTVLGTYHVPDPVKTSYYLAEQTSAIMTLPR